MATQVTTLAVGIEASGAKKGADDFAAAGNKVISSADSMAIKISGIKAAIDIAVQAFNALKAPVTEFINAANIQEKAVNQLGYAIANNSNIGIGALGRLIKAASEMQNQTLFGDEQILQAQVFAAAFAKSETQLLKMTKAAADFATVTGGDLRSAMDLLTKAAEGNVSMLARYGIRIDESIPKSKQFEAVLALIEQRFGGAAQNEINTYAGRIAQLSGLYGDLKEELGLYVTKNKELNALLEAAIGLFLNLNSELADNRSELSGLIDVVFALAKGVVYVSEAVEGVIQGFKIFRLAGETALLYVAQAWQRLQIQAIETLDYLASFSPAYVKNLDDIEYLNKLYESLDDTQRAAAQAQKEFQESFGGFEKIGEKYAVTLKNLDDAKLRAIARTNELRAAEIALQEQMNQRLSTPTLTPPDLSGFDISIGEKALRAFQPEPVETPDVYGSPGKEDPAILARQAALQRQLEMIQQFNEEIEREEQESAARRLAITTAFTEASFAAIESVVAGRTTLKAALSGIAQDVIRALIAPAKTKAAFELAEGLAALATGNPGAGLHFAAAAKYAAIAGIGSAAIGGLSREAGGAGGFATAGAQQGFRGAGGFSQRSDTGFGGATVAPASSQGGVVNVRIQSVYGKVDSEFISESVAPILKRIIGDGRTISVASA